MTTKLKTRIEDLAACGGPQAFDQPLHVGCPNLGDESRFLERLKDALGRRWLTNDGPFVRELEQRVAELTGVKHCVATCNATIALEILFRALNLKGEVILPSFTFVATAQALQWLGIKPVFCDIEEKTHNLDPSVVETLIKPETSGIVGVHLWGRPCEVDELREIAERNRLVLVFDAAHAFGCSHKGRDIGGFGDAEVFSFHATKFVHSFEGGAITTNDGQLADRLRLMRNFGIADYDKVVCVGTNAEMNEVSAAMGLTSLESLEEFISANRRNYRQYMRELNGLPGISLLVYDEVEKSNYQYIVLEINEDAIHLNRDQLGDILWAENILGRRYFYPGCHRMEPYLSLFPQAGLLLPHTEALADRVLSLPTGAAVGRNDIEKICGIIHFVVKHGQEIRERLIKKGNSNPLKKKTN